MKEYIELNELIRETIKTERKKRKINGVIFSKEILGLSGGYISHLEKGIISKIERSELEKIFGNILKIYGEELTNYIDSLIKESNSIVEASTDDDKNKVNEYNMPINDNEFNNLIKIILKRFKIYHGQTKNKEFLLQNMVRFNNNMHFDIGFMASLVGIPFFALQESSVKERQALLNEIGEIFGKYAKKFAESDKSTNGNDDTELNG